MIVAVGSFTTGIVTGAATLVPPLDGSFVIRRFANFTHSTRSLAPPANCKTTATLALPLSNAEEGQRVAKSEDPVGT